MSRRVSSPKSTSGEGFAFEDDVVAYYLTLMLLQKAPLGSDIGYVIRLDFQTETFGWFLDDLLITFKSPAGHPRRWAISIKSNTQFTAKSAPRDFTRSIWKQFLRKEHPNPQFDIQSDFLGLATAPHGTRVARAVNGLLGKARAQHPADLKGRLDQPGYAHNEGNLLATLRCPEDLAQGAVFSDADTVRLVAAIIVEEFDFHKRPSKDRGIAIEHCRSALRSESPDDAESLWNDLVAIAKAARPKNGYFDLPKLASQLRDSHELKAFPRYASDWNAIDEWTRKRLMAIPENIGRTISLQRNEQRQKIISAVDDNRAVAILGQSGAGKTVLLKHCVVEWGAARVVWIDAQLLGTIELDEFERRIGIHHSLKELLSAVPDRRTIFVFDAVDRLVSQSSFSQLSALVKASGDIGSRSIRFVVTCQTEEWSRVRVGLTQAGCPINDWEQLGIQQPTIAELQPIWEAFPSLRLLASRPHLTEIIRMPRILDVLASRLSDGEAVDAEEWIGESSLISWYWESEVKSHEFGEGRSAFLQRLAMQQADDGVPDTPLFDVPDGNQYLRDLVERRICVERMERVSFYHDSIGDWARQRSILAASRDLQRFIANRINKPEWHRAIRLYAIHLLETSPDASEWTLLISRVPAIIDFLLDAVIFSANPTSLLATVWPTLINNEGTLLRRFLKRFRHVASQPNRSLAQVLLENSDASPFLRTIDRDPRAYWPSWRALFRFVPNSIDDLRTLAAVEGTTLAQMWLTMTPPEWPERLAAAELAVSIAEDVEKTRVKCRYVDDEEATVCYSAALAAARELPERLVSLLRRACSLVPLGINGEGEEDIDSEDIDDSAGRSRNRSRQQTCVEPWPDGPVDDIDVAVRNACINGRSLDILMESNPSFTRQMILSLLIEVRTERSRYSGMSLIDDVAVEQLLQFRIPFYRRGPFLRFLQISPTEGMVTIIRLVNHATSRWCELPRHTNDRMINERGLQVFDSFHRLYGEFECFHWNRGEAHCSGAVVSALMALEKWLQLHVEKNESIAEYVTFILEHTSSVATLGVLADLGRSAPGLFQGTLRPLLAIAEFYIFDIFYVHSGLAPLGMHLDTRFGEEYFIELRDWLYEPSRKRPLYEIAMELFGKDAEFREFVLSARNGWLERMKTDVPDNLRPGLERLCELFSPDCWVTKTADDGSIEWIYNRAADPDDEPEMRDLWDRDPRVVCEEVVRFCLDSISERTNLNASELEEFWGFCQEMKEKFVDNGKDLSCWLLRAEAAVAVLLLSMHLEWLKQFTDRKSWCEERLYRFTVGSFKVAHSEGMNPFTTEYLASYVANLASRMWADKPQDRHYREWIAIVATRFGAGVASAVLKSAFEMRGTLGASFQQLVHFVLRFSAADWESSSEISQMKRKTAFDLDEWRKTESIAFVDATIPSQFPEFSSTWLSEPQIWWAKHCGHNDNAYRRVPPMTLSFVEASLCWIPPLTDAFSREERRSWVFLWQEAVTLSTSLARLCDRDGNPLLSERAEGGMPFKFDEWLFERIANVVLESDNLEEVRPLWQPIMALGRQFHWWVHYFLHPFFCKGLESCDLTKFPVLWRQMAQFALQTDSWVEYEESRRMRDQDLWCELLGLGDYFKFIWKPEHEHFVRLAMEWYEPVARHVLTRSDTAVHLLRWLRIPAAAPLRDRSLAWIIEIVKQQPTWIDGEETLKNEIACLLDHCWRIGDIKKESGSDIPFRELVRLLSEHQNLLAMDLEDRIARGSA